ncbi:unnamed protein product [Urochloa decumbens]|uniref:DUF1618 domain-containing protein n=1 Tax=Urochloa decumbens TaxID=240449 RepID=A0ABC9A2B5_9POAL
MSSSSAAGWALLEPYVIRKDDDESFPDEAEAPFRASSVTSWGSGFRVAFSLAEPPRISRLYAKMPVPLVPPPWKPTPVGILATHRHLTLLPFYTKTPHGAVLQDMFVFRANQSNPSESSLHALPPCTEPKLYYYPDDGSLHGPPPGTPRLLQPRSLGLWCGDEDEFVVAELRIHIPPTQYLFTAFADILMLHGRCISSYSSRWKSMRVEILCTNHPDDLWKLCHWQPDTAIAVQRWLCWIDYHQGILFCDMSRLPNPTVTFISFPLNISSPLIASNRTRNILYSCVSVVSHQGGNALKFANVAHHDDGLAAYGALNPSNGFTITCHTLVLGGFSMEWEDYSTVTSDDLGGYPDDCLQHGTLKFPRVDFDRPHVVHFLSVGFGCAHNKMWVVSIDMSTKTVESSYLFMNGTERLLPVDTRFIIKKLTSPLPFLACEFPRFCSLSRYEEEGYGMRPVCQLHRPTILFHLNIRWFHKKKAFVDCRACQQN